MTPLLAAGLKNNFPLAVFLSLLAVAVLVAVFFGIDILWLRRKR